MSGKFNKEMFEKSWFERFNSSANDWRRKMDTTFPKLASLCEISYPVFHRYLNGEVIPGTENHFKYCSNSKVSADWLLTGRGNMYFDDGSLPEIPNQDVLMSAMNMVRMKHRNKFASEEEREFFDTCFADPAVCHDLREAMKIVTTHVYGEDTKAKEEKASNEE